LLAIVAPRGRFVSFKRLFDDALKPSAVTLARKSGTLPDSGQATGAQPVKEVCHAT
jgi:hypothetical protein